MLFKLLPLVSALLLSDQVSASALLNPRSNSSSPTATVLNGTYFGKAVPEWQQDHFLGIPFAYPPVGPLRFKWPQSLNTSFEGARNATEYGFSCYQYGTNFSLSEDCLTLNVIRPTGVTKEDKLPVLVWIYGGGLYAGSTADPQYNLSGITRVGQDIGKPVITVSMNYRLGLWGFLQTPQLLAEGNANAGLLDQRLALRWIQENIASFGGDPSRVTVWGESAGAQSIAFHLHSYAGRDDRLFSAAILESGGPTGAQLQPLAAYTVPVENLTRTLGCWTAKNQLQCLREVPSEELFRNRVSQVWNPLVDGDFLTAYPSTLTAAGKFIKMPLLDGANSDEGSSFGVSGLDNETAIFNNLLAYRGYAIAPDTIRTLLELYPNDPANEPPYAIKEPVIFPSKGLQWRRHAAIAGDIVMIAQRRKMCIAYTEAGQDVYSYRFDTPLWNAAVTDGARHFTNVVFSFQNISGALGPVPQYANYTRLARDIGVAYISFANAWDPNPSSGGAGNTTNSSSSVLSTLPYWPKYDVAAPKNVVLNSNGSFVEPDTFRKEAMAFVSSVDKEFWA
ncbi:carboxylesterase family protein [Phlyctema vagabunda]|uniref:Carboxylic ester hydrolase n=1 Tax=Phlyctema vagabunda TaxID=108571 RepID=A0ABR4PPG2_9HELO